MESPSLIEKLLVRAAAGSFSRYGHGRSLLVLIFHRVLPEPDPILTGEPDVKAFTSAMDLLAASFNVFPLLDAAHRLRERTLPARAACVTFDDGYANNLEFAQPILQAKGVPATVFVATGFLDGGRMFNDTVIETVRRAPQDFDLRALGLDRHALRTPAARRELIDTLLHKLKYLEPRERLEKIGQIANCAGASLPDDLMMTTDQVRRLHRSGVEIGAHTVDHPILTSIDDATAARQMADSKRVLESIVGEPVRSFAYPNGRPQRDYDRRHVAMARAAGFDLALSTAWGAATADSDPFQIPRVGAWDTAPLKYGLRLARAYGQLKFDTA